jgi:hypothetical protein
MLAIGVGFGTIAGLRGRLLLWCAAGLVAVLLVLAVDSWQRVAGGQIGADLVAVIVIYNTALLCALYWRHGKPRRDDADEDES